MAGAYFARLQEQEFLLITEQMPPGSLLNMLAENVVADEVEFSDESEKWEYFSLKISEPDALLAPLGKANFRDAAFSHLEDGLFCRRKTVS